MESSCPDNALFRKRFSSYLWLIIMALFSGNLMAQGGDYKPAGVTCQFSPQEISRQSIVTQKQLTQLKESWRKEAATVLKERNEDIAELCTGRLIITDPSYSSPYQRIFRHIIQANNLQSVSMQLYLGKQPWPNAFSAGEGSLVLQVGLLPILRNETEMAFVICHEIAHYTLDHSTKSLVTYFEQLNATETKASLKQLGKQEYGAKTIALQLLGKLTFTNRRHSRFNESSADSLALIYLDRAGYNTRLGALSMQSLDNADTAGAYVSLAKHFNLPGFPFEERWTKKTKTLGSSKIVTAELNADSLKTHPDCSNRLAAMEQMLNRNGWKEGDFNMVSADSFAVMQRNALFEQVDSWYTLEQYDNALFEALRLTDLYPNHPYGYVQAGKILQGLCLAYSKFDLAAHVHTPSAALYSENFNELLRMMQRLSLEEMIRMTAAYILFHAKKWEATSGSFREMAAQLPAIKKLQP